MKEIIMLVTPEEAVKLSDHSWPYTYGSAVGTYNAINRIINEEYSDTDPSFNKLCAVQATFEAGRIQGIREERQRRKEAAPAKPEEEMTEEDVLRNLLMKEVQKMDLRELKLQLAFTRG